MESITNWPACIALCVVAISVCSIFVGRWPFQPGDVYNSYENDDVNEDDYNNNNG